MDDYQNDLEKKKELIFKNSEFIKDYSEIIKILDENNCKYTKNKNGVFLNLSTLSNDMINKIYPYFFNNNMVNNFQEVTLSTNNPIVLEGQMKNNCNQKTTITYTIPYENFSPNEVKIIKYSNNYIL